MLTLHTYTCTGTYFTELHKMVYLDNRRYLPMSSSLRQESESFPSKSEEVRPTPSRRAYTTLKNVHAAYDAAKTKYVCKYTVFIQVEAASPKVTILEQLPHLFLKKKATTFNPPLNTVNRKIFVLKIFRVKMFRINIFHRNNPILRQC